MNNYATIQVRDALARVEGVGEATVFGAQDYSMRVWLDPDKLQSRNLTAGDVIRVLREQNVQVAAGQIGQPPVPQGQDFQYTMSTLGRLVERRRVREHHPQHRRRRRGHLPQGRQPDRAGRRAARTR